MVKVNIRVGMPTNEHNLANCEKMLASHFKLFAITNIRRYYKIARGDSDTNSVKGSEVCAFSTARGFSMISKYVAEATANNAAKIHQPFVTKAHNQTVTPMCTPLMCNAHFGNV